MTKKRDLPAQFEWALRILKEGGVDPDFLGGRTLIPADELERILKSGI